MLSFARRQTWVAEGGAKDQRLVAALRERAVETADGWTLPAPDMRIGVVGWAPATDAGSPPRGAEDAIAATELRPAR